MAEIVNLRRARKAKERAAASAAAAANPRAFGRSKADRARGEAESDVAARRLEGHRLGEPERDES